MSQFAALIWLKWTLFRNTLRSRRAAVSSIAATLGTLVVLAFALSVAAGLGTLTYYLASMPAEMSDELGGERAGQVGFVLLLAIFAFMYLMWAIVPLGISGGRQFDPGRLLLYPISLRRLFAIDYLSELTSLSSIVALPSVWAIALGAGLASGEILRALAVGACATAFGISFAKLLSTSVGALTRRRRTRGETLLALLGALAGLSGMFVGQLGEVMVRNAESLRALRWTPPGMVAAALTEGLRAGGGRVYLLSVVALAAWSCVFVAVSYLIARRAALGIDGTRRASKRVRRESTGESYAGWHLPLLPGELSAVVEKEARYVMRNAQLRMLALMPLILLTVRFMTRRGGLSREMGRGMGRAAGASTWTAIYVEYGEGLLAMGGVLYVFLILSSVACNSFAFEGAGMRALILAPVERRTILLGKNIVLATVAAIYSALLLVANQLVFRDLTFAALIFAALSFVIFAAAYAHIGNWMSINFPKRMNFGKRLKTSGVTDLLMIPIGISMTLAPLAAVAAGFLARSLTLKYVTLGLFAAVAVGLYALLITRQGRALARRERDILETVSQRDEG
ncbi:MAG TPA: hypothetical protein VNA19_06395 [Pyrinomonadaceae bacterium]|jgi:hypothetical protein|nr:hypothetical protein [Pyrinomonadaceae bacterium]